MKSAAAQKSESAPATLEQLRERLRLQSRLQQELLSAGNQKAVAEIGLRYLRQLLPAQRGAIMLLDPETETGRLLTYDAQTPAPEAKDLFVGLKYTPFFVRKLKDGTVYSLNQGEDATDPDVKPILDDLAKLNVYSLLCTPLLAHGHLIGMLNLGADQPHRFNRNHLAIAEEIATPVALALHQAELHDAEREQRVLAEALIETGSVLNATLDFEQVLDRVLEQIARVVPFETATILMFDGDEAYIARHKGFTDVAPAVIDSLATLRFNIAKTATLQETFRTRGPVLIPDVTRYPGWVRTEFTDYIRSFAAVPIIVDDQIRALICVDNSRRDFYQQVHVKRLQAFANQVGLAWRNAQYHQATSRQLKELRVLHEVANAVTTATDEDALITAVTHIIGDNLYPDNFGALLLDPDQTILYTHASYKMGPRAKRFIALSTDEGIVGIVVRTKRPFRHGHVQDVPEYVEGEPNTRSELCVPIHTEKQIYGVINTESHLANAYSEKDEQLLVTIAYQLAIGIEKLRYAAQLETRVAERTQELAAANQQLKQLDRLKSQFVADVSHELRTPITNLGLYLDLFTRSDGEKQEKYRQILIQQVERLNNLVTEILSLSRIELGREMVRMEPVQLNEIVTAVVEAHKPQIAAQQLTCELDLQPTLPPISGEPNQLAQVITNLLTNAIRYTPQGDIAIRTWHKKETATVKLEVTDTGIGIDEDEISHLFQRFYRGKRVSQLNIPGTGLGLAIVQEIIRLHQGEITVKSEIDQGTIITVSLPEDIQLPANQQTNQPTNHHFPLNP